MVNTLLLAIAAVLALGALLALTKASRRKADPLLLSIDGVFEERSEPRLPALRLRDAMGPENVAIWQTQLPLAQAGEAGLCLERLRPCFRRMSASFPELYEGSTLEDSLRFGEAAQLVFVQDNAVWITREGREFVRCYLPQQRSHA
jgi:hypothetical protein